MSNIIAAIQTFAKESIKPLAQHIDSSGQLPTSLLAELADAGFFRVGFPQDIGGFGLSARTQGQFIEYAGRYCANVKNLFLVSMSMVGGAICSFGNSEQIANWAQPILQGAAIGAFCLTEPEVGSDISSIRTRFEAVDGGYEITGVKKWITLGGVADFFIVAAQQQGKTEAFLVDAHSTGIKRHDLQNVLCNRASSLAEIQFERVFVPYANHLVCDDRTHNSVISTVLDIGRYHSAWGAIALAGACIEEMIAYARKREQFGRKIRSHQLIQKMIADANSSLVAARALAGEAGDARQAAAPTSNHLSTMAKYFSAKMVVAVANDALRLHGANGISECFPVARYYREAKAFEIIEGTTEVLAQWIAQVTCQQGCEI